MNRVVAVSAFYKTKRTADEQVSFAKNDNSVNLAVNRCLARTAIKEAHNSFLGLGVYLLKSKFRIEGKLRFP